MKKFLTTLIAGMFVMTGWAQNPMEEMMKPLPLNPEVKTGKLDNGLTYYILHNEEPKERVNFYIAQKVGSTLEQPDQLGLAHFLEHMAFNGTQHYPGKNMLNYLQSKGIRFGADINAYTGFDETVYNINNVPSTDTALIDSVLLVLADWSGSILLAEDEIEAERGVIQEEWRSRNTAQTRMFESILPSLYQEYQYQQMPIGKMEVVMNFKPEALRAYYKKWYRPDQQGIVVVGDIDVDRIENKIKEMFSSIPMPENAAPREYASVSNNEKPIYAYFTDKEFPYSLIMVSFKKDALPFELKNSMMAILQEDVVEELIATMINNRLEEYSKKPECKYTQANVYFGDYWVSKTKSSFDIQIIAKDDLMESYKDAVSIVAQACKTGFMEGEIVRARDQILANYEKTYNERKNTKNETLARQLIRTFIDNDANPGIEKLYEMMRNLLPMIPVQAINEEVKGLMTPDNQVIVISEPQKEEMTVITEESVTAALNDMINAEYTPYIDEVLPETLITNKPTPGSVTSTEETAFSTTTLTLSNGAKVIVKTTDFQADEILLSSFRKAGAQTFPESEADNVRTVDMVFDTSKRGEFKRSTIDKYLAGKKIALSFNIGNTVTTLDGKTTVKDLPYLMEQIYLAFTDIQPDLEAYNTQKNSLISMLKTQENNPQFIFGQRLSKARACGQPLFDNYPSIQRMENANYDAMMDILKNQMKNAADYTFVFTGNITAEQLKPMLEQYIASLPSTGKAEIPATISPIPVIKGEVNDLFDIQMEIPSTQVWVTIDDNNIPFNCSNSAMIQAIADILDIVFTETLREEEGGTYSPQAFSQFNQYTGYWSINYWFQTNSDIQQKLIDRANTELINLLNNGAKHEHFSKVKEAMMKQYEINVRTNKYWDSNLTTYILGYDTITDEKAAIEGMTLEGLNTFMKNLYNGKNRLNFVMTGVAKN